MKIIPLDDSAALGAAMRAERKAQGLRQTELAAMAGVGVVTIYHLEHGKPTARLDALRKVASALGLRLALVAPHAGDDER